MPDPTTKKSIELPEPDMQPPSRDADPSTQRFASNEILWWNNGIWGEAGYAIPNDGGKTTTGNETVHGIHDFIGAELFNLMHRPDVKMSRPFNAEWMFDLNKMLRLGIKRMNDYAVGWTDERKGDADKATNTPHAFIVYPVPFFGGRIRQKDARRWCGIVLRLLSEIMQHSDNEYDDDLTNILASKVQEQLNRIRADMAMKYLGFSREQVAGDFEIPDTAFDQPNYDPGDQFTSRELVEERQPAQWWPTANDLTEIAGVPVTAANLWAMRWPMAGEEFYGDAADAAAFPGTGHPATKLQKRPGKRK